MDIICKPQSRHKTCVSQTSASKLNQAMCHFPDVTVLPEVGSDEEEVLSDDWDAI
jgi:hypothetical protein